MNCVNALIKRARWFGKIGPFMRIYSVPEVTYHPCTWGGSNAVPKREARNRKIPKMPKQVRNWRINCGGVFQRTQLKRLKNMRLQRNMNWVRAMPLLL